MIASEVDSPGGALFAGAPSVPLCSVCSAPIPANRLLARPTAGQCVPCLTAAGDVRLIRRYDEYTTRGTHETYFLSNSTLDVLIRRTNTHAPSGKLLADVTDAPIVETKRPEREAMRRADSTTSQIIDQTEERHEEVYA